MKRLSKAHAKFTKGFSKLERMSMSDHHRERIGPIRVPLMDLMSTLGYGGGPGSQNDQPGNPGTPGGVGQPSLTGRESPGTDEGSPMGGEVGWAFDTDPVMASTKLIGTPDMANLRKLMSADKQLTKGFSHLFKHMEEEGVREVVRQQALDHLDRTTALVKELYVKNMIGGETTNPQPRI